MTCYCRTGFAILVVSLVIIGCGASTPPATTDVDLELSGNTNRFIDWNQLDWKFPRYTFAAAYMFDQDHPRSSFDIYQEATKYDGPVEPLSLSEFLALPVPAQNARRKAAAIRLDDAMAFHRIMLRSWEIWIYSRRASVAQEAFRYEHGLISHTLTNLETAAGLDAANPYTWQHLGFFAGLVGDYQRQLEALNSGLNALQEFNNTDSSMELMRLRMLLDRSWLHREMGHFSDSKKDVEQAINQMVNDDQRTLDQAREALLLQALIMVDLGHSHEARIMAKKLESWKLPLQKTSAQSASSASIAMTKDNLEHIESDFARQWVWAMTYLKLDDSQQALAYINKQKWVTEFPAHLNYRFWQDMGRIQESFGRWDEAKVSYGFAVLYRPFFPFYPMQGARGLSRVFSQTGTGHTYYLGYGSMFVAGSFYSFAANRVISMEVASDEEEKQRRGQIAVHALTTCVNQNIRTASVLALRGRVHYRLGNFAAAEKDLHGAHELLMTQGRESSDVVKLLAVLHFDREDFLGSLALLSVYEHLKPRDGFGWRLSGLALAHLDRFDEALSALDHALELDPRAAPGWYNRALVHLHLGEVELARTDLNQARKLWPHNEEINRVARLISDNPQAKISIKSDPIELKISRQDSLFFAQASQTTSANLAANLNKQDLDQLLENLQEDYEDDPSTDQRLILGRTLIQAGRMDEVQDLLVPLWPDEINREETELLLRADRSLGHPVRAIKLARSLKGDPDPLPYSDFWALVAIICLENGATDSGKLALDMALELDPENVALLRMKFSPG